jgi:hypothetical protein
MSQINRYEEMKKIQLYLEGIFAIDVNEFCFHTSSPNGIVVNMRYLNQNGSMTKSQQVNRDVLNCISEALNESSSHIRDRAMEIFKQKTQEQKEKARQETETFLQENLELR